MTDQAALDAAVKDLRNGFDEFKSSYDERLADVAKKGDVDVIVRDKMAKLQEMFDKQCEIVERAGTELKTAQDKIAELETAVSRSGSGGASSEEEDLLRRQARAMILTDAYDQGRNIEDFLASEIDPIDVRTMKLYNQHFKTYLRKGQSSFEKRMGPDLETRLLSVDREPGGGYWVTPVMSDRVIKKVFESSPIRQFATIETIGTDAWEILTDLNEAGFGWVAEQEQRPETGTPDIGKRVVPAHEMYAEPRATQKLLDDAGFNVEEWLAEKVSEKFARAEATAFVTGNGVTKPRGFTTYPNGTSGATIEQITSTATDVISPEDIYKLIYAVKAPYLPNARFMAKRLTVQVIRLFRDESGGAGTGQFMWQPNFQAGQPQLLAGYPIHQAEDMAAVAAEALPLAFGDFRAGYTVVDRMGIRTLRDPYTAKPNVKFYTTRRVGGDVVNFEAIKLLLTT